MAIGRSSKPRFILLRVKRSLKVQDMMDIRRKRKERESNPIPFVDCQDQEVSVSDGIVSSLLHVLPDFVREELLESELIFFTCDFFSTSCSISSASSFMSALFFCDMFSELSLNFVWQNRLKQFWITKETRLNVLSDVIVVFLDLLFLCPASSLYVMLMNLRRWQ